MVMDMELSSRHHHLLPLRPPFSFLASPTFFSPQMCHHIHCGNILRFAFSLRSRSTLVRPLMSSKKGHSRTNYEGLCEVVWTVEADLADGELLYVTGDPDALGCWQPEIATLLHPTETSNLWKAEVKIPAGVDCKYNYFIKPENSSSCDIIWRPGPEFSLLIPSTFKHNRKIVVRDSWTKFNTESSPDHVWGSWIEETYQPLAKLRSPGSALTDKEEIIQQLEIYSEEQALEFDDTLFSSNDNAIIVGNNGLRSVCSERSQPVEEPWLLQSSIILPVPKDMTKTNISENVETAEVDVNNHHFLVHEKQMTADGSTVPLRDDSVSTIILINSSICSLQRIAILEDEKLVELLLEPVKSNVQCDSVYLGVVTHLVPQMGGAFVNIGSSRASLLNIKKSREPFIFPPFCQSGKKKEVNGSVLEPLEEHLSVHENRHSSHDVEVTDAVMELVSKDDIESFMHDDHDENEVDDDFDISEGKENINGARVGDGKIVADFKHDLLEQEHHSGDKVINNSDAIETEVSINTRIPQSRDIKDPLCSTSGNKWAQVCKGTKIVVEVTKEGLGTKGPAITAYPKLSSRFWVLMTRSNKIGVSNKISGVERTRLKVIAKTLQPAGFGLLARSVAAGHSLEELQKDLQSLLSTWKNIMEHAKSAALAADEGVKDAVPVMLHRAMGQTVSIVQDYFNEKVKKMVVDSPRTYHEVTNYLQEIAPDLCDRVELYDKRIPLFDEFNIEEEINNILSKRVPLARGGSLVIEETEALVSIDVNGGHAMFGHGTSQEKAALDVNLAAAKQIAREIRLRDIGGIIVVDFIDMYDDSNKRLVYEEMKRAVARDRSSLKVSELSKLGLMEMTRKRVRPSVTYMITEPCSCCHATGRVEALDTSFSKIEQEICRLLATLDQKADPGNPKTWPRFILRVDHYMCKYLTSGKKTKLAVLSSALKVWIILKVARGFARGTFEVKLFTDDKAKNDPGQVAVSVLKQVKASTVNSGRKVTIVPVKKGKSAAK